MARLSILRLSKCTAFIFFMMLPLLGWSEQRSTTLAGQDQEKREKKQDKKKEDTRKPDKKDKPDPGKEDIMEVPKARKQSRPGVVAKPNVKVKPVKVTKPKIKKP